MIEKLIKTEFSILLIEVKMIIITDKQITYFIKEKKIIPRNFNPNLKDKGIHFELQQQIIGENGNTFKVIVRQNKINPLDFSIIFGVFINGKVFRIKRYNGDSHDHTNKIEKTQIEGFHIHIATQRYQENGFEEEGYAESSQKYSDWRRALNWMLKENNFDIEVDKKQTRLLQ